MNAITGFIFFLSLKPNTSGPQQDEIGEVCIANISPYERRIRLMFAIRQFVVTLVVLGVLMILWNGIRSGAYHFYSCFRLPQSVTSSPAIRPE